MKNFTDHQSPCGGYPYCTYIKALWPVVFVWELVCSRLQNLLLAKDNKNNQPKGFGFTGRVLTQISLKLTIDNIFVVTG